MPDLPACKQRSPALPAVISAKMASTIQVVFFLGLTSGLFIVGTMSQEDINAPAPNCPPGWTQFRSRCFIFYRSPKSWIEAERACIKIGGNLASIHNAEENDFLTGVIRRVTAYHFLHTWIGGYDAVQEHQWQWSDGTSFDYLRWGIGRPYYHTYANCLEINYSGSYWADSRCYYYKPYICAKDVKNPV